jgi:hypothetical protein
MVFVYYWVELRADLDLAASHGRFLAKVIAGA